MAPSPTQLVWRRRIEAGLRLAEPGLNLVLVAADRFSRAIDRDGSDAYVPPRPPEAAPAPQVPRAVAPPAAER